MKRHDPSIREYASYVPVGQAVAKLRWWEQQGAEILYLGSHRRPENAVLNAAVLAASVSPPARSCTAETARVMPMSHAGRCRT